MRKKSALQAFWEDLRDSHFCHISSDEECPTLFIHPTEPQNLGHSTKNSANKTKNCRISNEEAWTNFLKKKPSANIVNSFVEEYFEAERPKYTNNRSLRHPSLTRYEFKDYVDTRAMSKLLAEEKKWIRETKRIELLKLYLG